MRLLVLDNFKKVAESIDNVSQSLAVQTKIQNNRRPKTSFSVGTFASMNQKHLRMRTDKPRLPRCCGKSTSLDTVRHSFALACMDKQPLRIVETGDREFQKFLLGNWTEYIPPIGVPPTSYINIRVVRRT